MQRRVRHHHGDGNGDNNWEGPFFPFVMIFMRVCESRVVLLFSGFVFLYYIVYYCPQLLQRWRINSGIYLHLELKNRLQNDVTAWLTTHTHDCLNPRMQINSCGGSFLDGQQLWCCSVLYNGHKRHMLLFWYLSYNVDVLASVWNFLTTPCLLHLQPFSIFLFH